MVVGGLLVLGLGAAGIEGALQRRRALTARGPSAAAPPPVAPAAPAAELAPPACPADMVLVEGSYCTDVRQDCNRWLDDASLPFARCAEYSHQLTLRR